MRFFTHQTGLRGLRLNGHLWSGWKDSVRLNRVINVGNEARILRLSRSRRCRNLTLIRIILRLRLLWLRYIVMTLSAFWRVMVMISGVLPPFLSRYSSLNISLGWMILLLRGFTLMRPLWRGAASATR